MVRHLAHATLVVALLCSAADAGGKKFRKPNAYEKSHQKQLKDSFKRESHAMCLAFVIAVTGAGLHCVDPETGKELIENAHDVVTAVDENRREREKRTRDAKTAKAREDKEARQRAPRTLQRDTARKAKSEDAKNRKGNR